MEPQVVPPADPRNLVERIDRAGAHRAGSADDEEGKIAVPRVGDNLLFECGGVHPVLAVGRDPANRIGAEAEEIRGLLDPGVRFGRRVGAKRRTDRPKTGGPHVAARLRGSRGEETDEIRHVAAAHEQPAGVGGKPDQLGDPADRLPLDFRRHRRQPPCADVRVHRRREQIAERPDRRGARRDVAEEARVAVEQRMLEEERGRFVEQRACLRSRVGQRAIRLQRPPHLGRRFVARDRTAGQRLQPPGDPIDQRVACRPKRGAGHLDRRRPARARFRFGGQHGAVLPMYGCAGTDCSGA
jgi:hypothetical protein